MNRRLSVFAVLLALTACGGENPPANQGRAPETAAEEGVYTLQIVFKGLVAYAQDSNKVWAFLVDADYEQPDANSLPPGVFEEIQLQISTAADYPKHLARLRLKNAEVLSGPTPDPLRGLPINGADIRFETGLTSRPVVDLDELSDAGKVFKARPKLAEDATLKAKIAALDKLDSLLVGGSLDSRLAARALIETGTVTAGPISCPGGRKKFSFKVVANGDNCLGEVTDAQLLAEQVLVEQRKVAQPTVIRLGPSLGSLTIKPRGSSRNVIVEILNQTEESLVGKECVEERHPFVFRWFYRLIPVANQANSGIHVFPCPRRSATGDPKCPGKRLVM